MPNSCRICLMPAACCSFCVLSYSFLPKGASCTAPLFHSSRLRILPFKLLPGIYGSPLTGCLITSLSMPPMWISLSPPPMCRPVCNTSVASMMWILISCMVFSGYFCSLALRKPSTASKKSFAFFRVSALWIWPMIWLKTAIKLSSTWLRPFE